MKNLIYRYLAIASAVLCLVSCEEPIVIPQEHYLQAQITNVELTSFDVLIDVPEAQPFYIARYESKDFRKQGVTAESITATLKKMVDYGGNWGTLLKVGSQSVHFGNLSTDTDYTVIAFGLNGNGEITTASVVLETTTEGIDFDIDITQSRPFDFVARVTPSRSDMGWYQFCFIGTEERFSQMDDELIQTYMGYYISNDMQMGYTYDEIAFTGTESFEDESYPDMKVMVCVAALDRSFKIVSSVTRMIFSPSLEGFFSLDEKRTEHLHTLIYAYDHRELGVLLHVTGYDKDGNQGVINNTMSFNGDSMAYFGIDFYSASDEQIADAMAWAQQYQFDYARNDPQYIPYFDQCTSVQQMLELIWYTPQNFYDNGRVWDRNDAADIIKICGGEQPDQLVFALGINKAGNNYQMYPAEYCISRCSFKELGYSFEEQSPALKMAGSPAPGMALRKGLSLDAQSGKELQFKRLIVK